MTVALYVRRKSWPLEAVTVRLRHSKIHAADCADCETKEGMLDHIDSDLEFAGRLTQEQRSKLLEIAEKCPVHRTLVSEIDIRSRVLWAMAHIRRITQQRVVDREPMWLAGISPRSSNFRVADYPGVSPLGIESAGLLKAICCGYGKQARTPIESNCPPRANDHDNALSNVDDGGQKR